MSSDPAMPHSPTRPELLAPAGDMTRLRTALAYGADAVYLAGPGLNLRAKSANFFWNELDQALGLVRERGKRAYFCVNALPTERDLGDARETLERLAALPRDSAPHALIIADPGVLRLARRLAPQYPVHLSTQANTANSESLAFWRDQGVTRVNLARELRLPDLRALTRAAQAAGGPELEIFVHGAACMAVSGRCLLSAYLNDRPANQGLCTHACRFDYQVTGVALTERTRPGSPVWELHEEDGMSALLAAQDICLIKYLAWFKHAGISAIKIEGRMRSAGWLAQVVDAYATALADLESGAYRPDAYLHELRNASLRGLDSGMFLPRGRRWTVSPLDDAAKRPVLAQVLEELAPGKYRVAVKARWDADKDVALLLPGLERPVVKAGEYGLENLEGEAVGVLHSGVEGVVHAARHDCGSMIFIH